MGARWKVVVGLVAIGAVVLVGLMLLRPVGKPLGELPSVPAAQVDALPLSAETNHAAVSNPERQQTASLAPAASEPAPASFGASLLITNWDDKLEEILAADGSTDGKARQMLDMFTNLPEAGQVEVARHLCNLVSDQDYPRLSQLLADPHLPQEVLDTLMGDALNRPNSLKLPALLEVARTPQHPKAGDAKEVLGFLLEADYGDDWPKWQDKVQEWLKDNPD